MAAAVRQRPDPAAAPRDGAVACCSFAARLPMARNGITLSSCARATATSTDAARPGGLHVGAVRLQADVHAGADCRGAGAARGGADCRDPSGPCRRGLVQAQISGARNYDYDKRDPEGCPLLAPVYVFDDGNRTTLVFAPHAVLPEIYVINQDGKEAIATTINETTPTGLQVVLPTVQREMRLRRGGKVCALRNNAFDPIGTQPGERHGHGFAGRGASGARTMSEQHGGPADRRLDRSHAVGRICRAGCARLARWAAAWWWRASRIWALWPKQAARGRSWTGDQRRMEHGPDLAGAPLPNAAASRPSPAPPIMRPSPARVAGRGSAADPRHGFWEDANAASKRHSRSRRERPCPARTPLAPGWRSGRGHARAGNSEYAQRMQTTRFADTAPMPHRFHVHYTIKKGTVFPCTPAQPISSSLPGPVQCTRRPGRLEHGRHHHPAAARHAGERHGRARPHQWRGAAVPGLDGCADAAARICWQSRWTPSGRRAGADRRARRRQRPPLEAHQDGAAAERRRHRRQRDHVCGADRARQHDLQPRQCRAARPIRWGRWRSAAI